MKIKVKNISYQQLLKEPKAKYHLPNRPLWLFRKIINIASKKELKKVNFQYEKIDMDKLKPLEPCFILMNHSSFLDLKMFCKIFYPKSYNIVCTDDGFVGKSFLMRKLGCIPTVKFQNDPRLIKDMLFCIKKLNSSILMFPEATYSFDGTNGVIPDNIGKCIKLLKVPLVIIISKGAFLHDPLYNSLQLRNVNVKCEVKYVLSKEDIKNKTSEEITQIVRDYFTFDNWKYQQENHILIKENFRADGLNRILYKCPHCLKEGFMIGKGIKITCQNCLSEYELTEEGYLKGINCQTIFKHVPDWYSWERNEVKKEIYNKSYLLEDDCEIYCFKNYKCIYHIGEGHLKHTINGFNLTNKDNSLNVYQSPLANYSLYSDFYWYEIDDVICICDNTIHYYCVLKNKKDYASKARLASEEIYKYLTKK